MRHDQRPDRKHMICKQCELDNCVECIDILRFVYNENPICECTRRDHTGEPIREQILDPMTGAIHAPHLTVTEDGEVIFHG